MTKMLTILPEATALAHALILLSLIEATWLGKPKCLQLLRERLWVKVHRTIPKAIVVGFELTVLQRNLKEWLERPWTYVCEF